MTLTLYGAPQTRVSMPRWYLEEKGIPYELAMLDLAGQEHRKPDYLAINPFGKLPALVDSGMAGGDGQPLSLFESGAILQHLEDHYSGEQRTAAQRSLTTQWLLFANATLATALFVPSNREREFPRLMQELNRQLASGRPLVGESWGAADCAVTAYLAYLPIFFPQEDLSPYPGIQQLIAETRQRPAYRKVMGMD